MIIFDKYINLYMFVQLPQLSKKDFFITFKRNPQSLKDFEQLNRETEGFFIL